MSSMMESSELPVQDILQGLGVVLQDSGDYWKFRSPWRADNDPSCVCYKSSGYIIDFGGSFRGGIKRFVFAMTGKSFNKEFPGLSVNTSNWGSGVARTIQKRSELRIPNITIAGRVDEVYDAPDALRYCYSRNMTDGFIKEFDLSYLSYGVVCESKMPWKRRLMIPIREAGHTLSIEGRDITRQQEKKALYPRTCTTSTLFNIDNLDKKQPLVIVEGIMDLVQVWKVHENVTCTFGIQMTHRQKELIRSFPDVVLLPDSDEAGERFVDVVDEFYENEFCVAKVPEKDPGDSTEENIVKALTERKPITRYLMEATGLIPVKEKLLW